MTPSDLSPPQDPQPHDPQPDDRIPTALVTGATGYIGSRLVPRLLADGVRVRVLARSPGKLDGVPWRASVEVIEGDLVDRASLERAMREAGTGSGVDVVHHLVHSMGTSSDFEAEERESAQTFVAAAEAAGVGRVVHLSGLVPDDGTTLSRHLRSRAEVARILLDSSVPALVLRAGVVIGAGSASFEMIRHLTSRLPAMITPKWVHNRIQPIAVSDALDHLAAAGTCPLPSGRAVDIGGPDVLEYGEMMQRYAEEAGLHRRVMVPVPLLTPTLSALWTGLVTPLPRGLAGPLVESLRCEAVAQSDGLAEDPTGPRPQDSLPYRDAVRAALGEPFGQAGPTWTTADPVGDPASRLPTDAPWAGPHPPVVWHARR